MPPPPYPALHSAISRHTHTNNTETTKETPIYRQTKRKKKIIWKFRPLKAMKASRLSGKTKEKQKLLYTHGCGWSLMVVNGVVGLL